MTQDDPRIPSGEALLARIGGADPERGIAALRAFSPVMAEMTIAFPYGEILNRPGLDLVDRQCCTIATLLANGSTQAQLKFHMAGLLNVGGDPRAIVELLVVATALVGFPVAIAGAGLLRELLHEQSLSLKPLRTTPPADRYETGRAAMAELIATDADRYTATFAAVSPELARWAVEYEFGDVLSRDVLSPAARQLAAITMLAARGNRDALLGLHIRGSLAAGLDRVMLEEALIQLAVYAGFPVALNAMTIAAQTTRDVPGGDRPADLPSGADEDRHARGVETMAASSGGRGAEVVASFDDVAPDIGRFIVEHSYGDVFSRTGIDARTRELTTIAALASGMTTADEGPLAVHVSAALRLGATRDEVVETILNVSSYRGHPAAQRAVAVLHGVLSGTPNP